MTYYRLARRRCLLVLPPVDGGTVKLSKYHSSSFIVKTSKHHCKRWLSYFVPLTYNARIRLDLFLLATWVGVAWPSASAPPPCARKQLPFSCFALPSIASTCTLNPCVGYLPRKTSVIHLFRLTMPFTHRSPTVHRGSIIRFYRNGVPQGDAFTDVWAGSYFPAVSCYYGGQCTARFEGPFKHPPNGVDYRPFCEAVRQPAPFLDHALVRCIPFRCACARRTFANTRAAMHRRL